jgi:hypothetical protein
MVAHRDAASIRARATDRWLPLRYCSRARALARAAVLGDPAGRLSSRSAAVHSLWRSERVREARRIGVRFRRRVSRSLGTRADGGRADLSVGAPRPHGRALYSSAPTRCARGSASAATHFGAWPIAAKVKLTVPEYVAYDDEGKPLPPSGGERTGEMMRSELYALGVKDLGIDESRLHVLACRRGEASPGLADGR